MKTKSIENESQLRKRMKLSSHRNDGRNDTIRTVSCTWNAGVTGRRKSRVSVHGVRTSLSGVRALVNRRDRLRFISVQFNLSVFLDAGIDRRQQSFTTLHQPQLAFEISNESVSKSISQ